MLYVDVNVKQTERDVNRKLYITILTPILEINVQISGILLREPWQPIPLQN